VSWSSTNALLFASGSDDTNVKLWSVQHVEATIVTQSSRHSKKNKKGTSRDPKGKGVVAVRIGADGQCVRIDTEERKHHRDASRSSDSDDVSPSNRGGEATPSSSSSSSSSDEEEDDDSDLWAGHQPLGHQIESGRHADDDEEEEDDDEGWGDEMEEVD